MCRCRRSCRRSSAECSSPASQPVSLARSNMGLLNERRYWVTWKADGTRYMLLLCHWGVTCPAQLFHLGI